MGDFTSHSFISYSFGFSFVTVIVGLVLLCLLSLVYCIYCITVSAIFYACWEKMHCWCYYSVSFYNVYSLTMLIQFCMFIVLDYIFNITNCMKLKWCGQYAADFRAYEHGRSYSAAACYISESGWRWRICIDRCKEHCHHHHTFLSQSRTTQCPGLLSIFC